MTRALRTLALGFPALLLTPTGQSALAEAADAEPRGWPRVTHVGAAAPDVLHVVVRTGDVVHPRQGPYEAEPGDEIIETPGGVLVRRDGEDYGALAWNDRTRFTPFERVVQVPFTPERWRQVTLVRIRSADDPAYGGGLPPERVELKTRPWEVSRVGSWQFEAPLEHHFFVFLPAPMTDGATYTLAVEGEGPEVPPYTHAPRTARSESVHVSQVGFRPDDPAKIAFVSTWTGTGGGLSYPEGYGFEIVEEGTGESVFEGSLSLARRAEDPDDRADHSHVKADVLEADFSTLDRPGVYRVSVEGVGASFPFPIAAEVWRDAFVVSTRGFYHHRRSIELGPPYTDYLRPRGLHPEDVPIYLSTTGLMDTGDGLNPEAKNNFDELVAGKTDELAGPNAWGGLMDAGDWDSRAQHLVVTRYLLEAVELHPDFFRGVGLNIPESGNDLPDVVDEALFNLDHYRRMQLPDGGVRGGVESAEHPRLGEASWQESLTVMAYAPDVWSSYLYAGAAARAAFVLELLGARGSDVYRETAERAMRWAEGRPADERTRYPEIRDTRALAAAELFRTTGDDAWHRVFLEAGDSGRAVLADKSPGTPVSRGGGEQRDAAFVYLRTERPGVDPKVREIARESLIADADRLVEGSKSTAFRWARLAGDAGGWPSFGIQDGVTLARAHFLTGEERYLETLVLTSQMTAGANPLNVCYTTGIGSRFARRPLHVDSNITGKPAPPGITVAGPTEYGTAWGEAFAPSVRSFLRPEERDWPRLETLWTAFWYPPINEYTVQSPMAHNAYVWGYLAARDPIGAVPDEPGERSPSALGLLEPFVVTRHSIRITVDPRVELMSIVQYLSSQYREKLPFLMNKDVFPYQEAVLARFSAHRSHPVVGRFDEIALRPGGFNFSFPPYAMLYVDAELRLRPDLALDGYLAQRAGGRESLEQLLELLADFCDKTTCAEFFADQEDYYRGLLAEVEKKIAHRNYVERLERFYGTRQKSYSVVLVSLYGAVGFGPHVDTMEGQRHIFNIMGPRGLEGGQPFFGDQDYYDYIQRHEFSHPFVNPLSTKHADAVASLSHVFDSLPESAKKVCGEWEECVNENIVRAVTTHLAFGDGPDAGRAALKRETDRGAVFVPALLELVREYDDNRDRYPTFGSYYENLLAAFRPVAGSP